MGDPTPRNPYGDMRVITKILERLRALEQARPLQAAFNDASAAQSTADGAQVSAEGAQTTATAAQGVAQGASYDAANANTAAQAAQQQAQAAQTSAASKTKTTWSTSAPSNTNSPGSADGDTWYVTNGTGGSATAQYKWTAASSAWVLTPIEGTVLRNVVADSVRAGAIDGLLITGPTIQTSATGYRTVLEKSRSGISFYSPDYTLPVGVLTSGQSSLNYYNPNNLAAGDIYIDVDLIRMAKNDLSQYANFGVAGLLTKNASGTSSVDPSGLTTRSTGSAGGVVNANAQNGFYTTLKQSTVQFGHNGDGSTPRAAQVYTSFDTGSDTGSPSGSRYITNKVTVGAKELTSTSRPKRTQDGYYDLEAAAGHIDLLDVYGSIRFADGTTQASAATGGDTGWKALSGVPSGITTSSLACRVVGGIVYLRGSFTRTAGSFPNGYTAVGTLPAGARPSAYGRWSIPMYNGYSAILIIGTDGSLQIGASGDRTADTVYVGGVSFPND